jgi:toxin ParE1/3/4
MARRNRAVHLYRRAESDFESIFTYTAETWSGPQAKRYTDRLNAAFEDLAAGVLVGRDSGFGDGMMQIAVGSHIMFYLIDEKSLSIVPVLHRWILQNT